MVENIAIPDVLQEALGNEKIEFFVKAKKDQPIRNCWSVIGFGVCWILVICLIFLGFVWELFSGECTTISIDGIPTEVCRDDLSPLKSLFIYFGVFLLPGIIVGSLGFLGLFKSGGYYIGTESRLIRYSWKEVKSFPWEDFTDDIEVFGTEQDGNIIFKLKTGVYVTRNHKKVLSNTKLNLGSIMYAFEIEKYCRNRITKLAEVENSLQNDNVLN
ncbi:hypothetical protein [Flavobacterium sp. N2038]|uniref:hypothetical protein n=1 Tax=Flavobacterium sp. N2038 TaxID=2986829 RepID=UPI00222537B0|nr:hypothetical protein [Flavobacterium sp. N2038]